MKFSYLVLTISLAAAPALAQEGQSADAAAVASPATVVNVTNTAASTTAATQTATQEAIQQPTTIVEAAPVSESKADTLRKARQNAEMQTEQKIVEKLEESRMKEEQQRAERLFGDRLENKAEATAVVVAPVVAAPVAAPVVAAPVVTEVKEVPPTQVTIEKVEVVQPAAQSVAPIAAAPVEKRDTKYYVGVGLGNAVYDASNVDSSYSFGLSVGAIMPSNVAVEGTFNYSNHNIDTYWSSPIYRELDQYDIGIGAKYYFLGKTLRPYAGGQLVYIYRQYTDRDAFCSGCSTNESETTQAVDIGPNLGLDVAVSDSFMIGVDFKYNFNFINKKEIDYAQYGLPADTQPLEEIDYYTFQITSKLTF
jgi:outer membrane protein W